SFTNTQAQSFTAEALGFNIFVEHDFVFGGGDVEASVAVGQDLTIQQNQGQFAIHTPGSYTVSGMNGPAGLVVGNKVFLNGGGVRLLSGAKLSIGNSSNSDALSSDQNGASVNTRIVSSGNNYNSYPNISLDHQQSAGVYRSSPIDFAAAFTRFRSRAASVGAMGTNMAITNANGNALDPNNIAPNTQVYIQNLDNGANILNLTGTNLNNITSITFNAKPSTSRYLVLNIHQTGSFDWSNFNFAGVSGNEAQHIVFNFVDATTVNLNGSSSIYGTIFAPSATVSKNNSANIDGQVIAQTFNMTQGGEIHRMFFLENDPNDEGAFPVEWLGVRVDQVGVNARIVWQTTQEISNAFFVVERAIDTDEFEAIAQVESQGNGNQIRSYKWEDAQLPTDVETKVHYRIMQVDIDGEFSYSPVQSYVHQPITRHQLKAYPNPSQGKITVDWTQGDVQQLVVVDLQGRQIIKKDLAGADVFAHEIQAGALLPGHYVVLISGLKGTMSTRILVQ
ncbi:MAG: collagen-binding domain-containing protein, partial [Bacteroidota bacterium]